MGRKVVIFAILLSWMNLAVAEDCAQEVIRNLFEDLEVIDTAGEERLARSLDQLSQQEAWSKSQRSDFTLSIADNPDVDAAESERGEIIARIFGLVQRGDVDCTEIRDLRAAALEVEKAQWDAAVKQVNQRIWH